MPEADEDAMKIDVDRINPAKNQTNHRPDHLSSSN